MASLLGAILGAIIAIYLLSKLLEWVLLRWIIKSRVALAVTSTGAIFLGVSTLWFLNLGKPSAQSPSFLIAYLIAFVILIAIRCSAAKKKALA